MIFLLTQLSYTKLNFLISLVSEYKEVIHTHRASITTMLNTVDKSKDKRNLHLLTQYDIIHFWMFLSLLEGILLEFSLINN